MSLRYKQAAEDQPPIATEQVGNDHFQLLKLVDPTPGSVSPIGTAANPMKVAGAAEPNLVGTWGYVAGTLTSGSLTGVGRCVGIRVYASGADGSFNLDGGSTITVRAGAGVDINPRAQVTAPVVNHVSGTLDVIIEGLT